MRHNSALWGSCLVKVMFDMYIFFFAKKIQTLNAVFLFCKIYISKKCIWRNFLKPHSSCTNTLQKLGTFSIKTYGEFCFKIGHCKALFCNSTTVQWCGLLQCSSYINVRCHQNVFSHRIALLAISNIRYRVLTFFVHSQGMPSPKKKG